MAKIIIGVLAHNEANVIGNILEDLLKQTILKLPSDNLEVKVCVVANGCNDDTADTSRAVLSKNEWGNKASWDVIELEQPSKTNAWNVFVHDIAPDDVDYLLLLDADIRLPQQDIVEKCISALQRNPDVWVVSDVSKNVFPPDSGLSFMKLVAPIVAGTASTNPHAICGQFYCAKAPLLKKITLPVGLLSQDGFIHAMIVTSALSEPANRQRIFALPGAYHLHPAYTKLSSRFRYEKRQAMSTTVYTFIYKMLNGLPPSLDIRMDEIKRLNREKPDWVSDLVKEECRGKRFPVPRQYVLKRLNSLKPFGVRKLAKSFVVVPALLFDIWVGWRASVELRSDAIGNLESNKNRFKIRASN